MRRVRKLENEPKVECWHLEIDDKDSKLPMVLQYNFQGCVSKIFWDYGFTLIQQKAKYRGDSYFQLTNCFTEKYKYFD